FAIGEPVITSFTILATAGPNGTINPSGSVIVTAGDDQTFDFYPATCYKVDSVFVDDGYIGAPSSYTFNDVDANHTIYVKFAMKTYTITVTQGANGTITPGTSVVNCGDDLAFAIAPSVGYHVDSVFADDVYVPDSTTSYTFKDIDANHSITAKYAINTYTLDVAVVGSGTVTKDPDQPTYNHGTSVELTATPDDLSWKFKEWSGSATGTTNPLSIIMDANKNITATFERDSAYLAMYRSFMPESVALDVDNKGKINKYVKRKPVRVDFLLYVVCDSNNVNDLHMEFSHAIEDGFPFGTIPPSTATPAETKNKKWDFAFSTTLNAGDTVYVYGYGNKGKEQKISKYWWSRDGAQLGKSSKIVTFVHNVPKLPMPNRVNALFETFLDGGYGTDGMVVGKIRTDSVKQYGWFQTLKYGDVLKTLIVKKSLTLHTGTPRGFDAFVNAKPLVKQQKSLPPTKHDNKLFAGLVALKFNITASGMGKIPRGFGELIYEDGTSNPLNGLMIKEIAAYGDSVMMGQYDEVTEAKVFAESSVYSNLAATVDSINRAFEGPLDTLYFADSLVFKGYKMLSEVSYLRANPSAIPAVIIPMQGGVPQEPVAYALYQNYPNPFNPITTIQFDLPEEAIVTLKVYNMLGQEIATLLDREEMAEGMQEVEFSAETLASGIYFYRLVAEGIDEDGAQLGSYQTVKKMILIR
ncbi:MAG: T9SS type A sorting domain-containing protein, partial [Ignavibacteriales bacterium]|nr:T9SS type A sorting domain-containing protein [Ignavibacteriales bacterium]